MKKREGAFKKSISPCGKYSATFEDDGFTVYGYLLKNDEKIISTVWLYNIGDEPATPDEGRAPRNRPEYIIAHEYPQIVSSDEIEFVWAVTGVRCSVKILLRSELFAELDSDSTPGRSILVKKDGPIARRLKNTRQ